MPDYKKDAPSGKSVLLEHDQKVLLNVLLEVDQKEPVAGRTKERKHGG